MGDRIELRGLRVTAVCGVLPEEQTRPQPFELDVDIEADLGPAGRSDDLGDTVDYGAVCEMVASLAASGRFALMEAFAHRVADEVLTTQPLADSVMVSVQKLRPPVAHHLDTSGVRIHLHR